VTGLPPLDAAPRAPLAAESPVGMFTCICFSFVSASSASSGEAPLLLYGAALYGLSELPGAPSRRCSSDFS
jgi:hypothetical protein